jgi:hypothetical protein
MHSKFLRLGDCNPGAIAVFLIGVTAVSLLAVSGF